MSTEVVKVHRGGPPGLETRPIYSYDSFMSRGWTVAVIIVAIIGFVAALGMLAYVLQKICNGMLAGNQSLGIVLLFGVLGLFCSVLPWLLPPSEDELIAATRPYSSHPPSAWRLMQP